MVLVDNKILPITSILLSYNSQTCSYLKLSYGILRILEPLKVIEFNKNSGNVVFRLSKFREMNLDISELMIVEYIPHEELERLSDDYFKKNNWGELWYKTRDQRKELFHSVNTNRIIDPGKNIINKEVSELTKKLAKVIAKELGVESRKQFRNRK